MTAAVLPPARLALAAGVFAISWAAILVRWADAPALAVAFWRMALATCLLLTAAAAGRKAFWRSWRGVDWATGGVAALLLALHFGFWIASLDYTSVASASVLVSMQPVFVALLGWSVLGERPHATAWLGIALALVGSVVIAGGDWAAGGRELVGDGLALLGAVWISGYYVLARFLRATKDLFPYVIVMYGLTAVWLAAGSGLAGVRLGGFDGFTWAALAGLAVGPTILGHSALNYALGYLRAYEVNVSILGEPIGATVWAAMFLSEVPTGATFVGGGLILAGIFLALLRSRPVDEVAAANL